MDEERKLSEGLREELMPLLLRTLYSSVSPERYQYLRGKVLRVPELLNDPERNFMSREDVIGRSIKYTRALKLFKEQESLTIEEVWLVLKMYSEASPFYYTYFFFKPIFEVQASEEQKAKYLPKIESLDILASFAQTELGHGSNVKGIEITATYEERTDTFVLHSPTVTATKWWVGSLGVSSNHAILIARLIIKGTDYGPHAFFLQIRDLKTHEPLPGIELGDIGPKVGLNGNDNGYMRFEYHRIPRDGLLSRFAEVSKGGEYAIKDPNGLKKLFASLVQARLCINLELWVYLSKCSTIAIRYSHVRRQFPNPTDSNTETQLIDYQVQQHKLFSGLAMTYAAVFLKVKVLKLVEQSPERIDDSVYMQSLHAIASMYKAFMTDRTYQTVEVLRRSCGGHGYLTGAGFHLIMNHLLGACTYDGDNTILALQAIKYIMKIKDSGIPSDGPFAVLAKEPPSLEVSDLKSFHSACFSHIAYQAVENLYRKYKVLSKTHGKRTIDKFLQIEGYAACAAFFSYTIHDDFCVGMEGFGSPAIQEAMEYLRQILAINELRYHEHYLVKKVDTGAFSEVLSNALEKIRPIALGLVEAFDHDDAELNSFLGRKDGEVYKEMYHQAKYLNPVNKHKVFPAIKQMIEPKL